MPQMMPMNWTFMFIMLNIIIFMVLIVMFNNTTTKYLISTLQSFNKSNMWTW